MVKDYWALGILSMDYFKTLQYSTIEAYRIVKMGDDVREWQ